MHRHPLRLRRIAVLAFSSIEKDFHSSFIFFIAAFSSTPETGTIPGTERALHKQIVEHCPQAEIFLLSPLPVLYKLLVTVCEGLFSPYRRPDGQIVHLPEVGQIFEYSISNEFRRFHSHGTTPQPPSARCRSESRGRAFFTASALLTVSVYCVSEAILMVSAAASFTHGVFRRVTVFSAASFSRFDTSRESAAFAGDAIS